MQDRCNDMGAVSNRGSVKQTCVRRCRLFAPGRKEPMKLCCSLGLALSFLADAQNLGGSQRRPPSQKGVWVWCTSSVTCYTVKRLDSNPMSDHLRHNHEECFISSLAVIVGRSGVCYKQGLSQRRMWSWYLWGWEEHYLSVNGWAWMSWRDSSQQVCRDIHSGMAIQVDSNHQEPNVHFSWSRWIWSQIRIQLTRQVF